MAKNDNVKEAKTIKNFNNQKTFSAKRLTYF